MISVVRLMHVAEDGKPYFPRYLDALEKFVAIVESDGVQPLAAHRYGRMMQANHDVFGSRGFDQCLKPFKLTFGDEPAGAARGTTVDSCDQPVVTCK